MNTPDLDHLIDLAESADAELSQEVPSEPSLRAQEPRFGGSPGPTLRRLFMPLALPINLSAAASEGLLQFWMGSWCRKPGSPRLGSGTG